MPTRNKRIKKRKLKYNTFLGKRLAALIAQGYSFYKLTSDEALKKKYRLPVNESSTLRDWVRTIPEFKTMVEQAYRDRADHYLDKYMDVLDQVESGDMPIKKAEFIAKQQQWLLEKVHPSIVESQKKTTTTPLTLAADGAMIQIILADTPKKALPIGGDNGLQIENKKEVNEGCWEEASLLDSSNVGLTDD